MTSFSIVESERVIQLCKMAKTVAILNHNKMKKEYEFQVEYHRKLSWWDKHIKIRTFSPSIEELGNSAIKRDRDLDRIKTIESGCRMGKNVYLSFEDSRFLLDRQQT